jgi:two-component system response regulator HydG
MAAKRILLVEDDRVVRFMLTHVLFDESYIVDGAASVSDALSQFARERYDLVIADWRLPDGSGLAIVDLAAGFGAKTIVISGYLFRLTFEAHEKHKFLMKPVRPSKLVKAVRRAIDDGRGAARRGRPAEA